MPAYVIADVTWTDPEVEAEYDRIVGPSIARYGGRVLAVEKQAEVIEGVWSPARFVILAFESAEQAKAWHNSPEYQAPKAMRERGATSNLIIVQGR